ncbi:MAG TPA: DUF434 domain-containing protein [Rectinemataceae bacterium]|nr:DUF434 domain-containing protein [Rectinemataceae bacterium]
MIFTEDFREAARDYRLLLDKRYPIEASIKLVGDRYRLDKEERVALFRGVLPGDLSRANAERRTAFLPAGARIAVDGYNVLFTIINYLRGHPLFVSTDGFLRDAGGAHGRIADTAQFFEAIEELCANVCLLGTAEAVIYLDAPISRSADHAGALRRALASRGIAGDAILVPDADNFVASSLSDVVCSSDSGVIAKARVPVFDLARNILEIRYCAKFTDLSVIVAG